MSLILVRMLPEPTLILKNVWISKNNILLLIKDFNVVCAVSVGVSSSCSFDKFHRLMSKDHIKSVC